MDFGGKEKGMAIKAKEDRNRRKQRENRGVHAMVTDVFSLFQAAGQKFQVAVSGEAFQSQ